MLGRKFSKPYYLRLFFSNVNVHASILSKKKEGAILAVANSNDKVIRSQLDIDVPKNGVKACGLVAAKLAEKARWHKVTSLFWDGTYKQKTHKKNHRPKAEAFWAALRKELDIPLERAPPKVKKSRPGEAQPAATAQDAAAVHEQQAGEQQLPDAPTAASG